MRSLLGDCDVSEEDTELQISESGRTSVGSTISSCGILVFLSG